MLLINFLCSMFFITHKPGRGIDSVGHSMALWVGLVERRRFIPKWRTPGPFASFGTVGEFAVWAAKKFCPYPPVFKGFAWLPNPERPDGVWTPIPGDESLNRLPIQQANFILSAHFDVAPGMAPIKALFYVRSTG